MNIVAHISLQNAVMLVGALTIFTWTLSLASFLNRFVLRRQLDFQQVYGRKDAWVMVTGGSDGIGL